MQIEFVHRCTGGVHQLRIIWLISFTKALFSQLLTAMKTWTTRGLDVVAAECPRESLGGSCQSSEYEFEVDQLVPYWFDKINTALLIILGIHHSSYRLTFGTSTHLFYAYLQDTWKWSQPKAGNCHHSTARYFSHSSSCKFLRCWKQHDMGSCSGTGTHVMILKRSGNEVGLMQTQRVRIDG